MAGAIECLDSNCCDVSYRKKDGCQHHQKLYLCIDRRVVKLSVGQLAGYVRKSFGEVHFCYVKNEEK